jgi:hypothetical protein
MTNTDNHHENGVKEDVAAKVYMSVAQSAALAIQDAVDNLRNVGTIATTAQGVAMAQMLENPADTGHYQKVIDMANEMSAAASANYVQVCKNAEASLSAFQTAKQV